MKTDQERLDETFTSFQKVKHLFAKLLGTPDDELNNPNLLSKHLFNFYYSLCYKSEDYTTKLSADEREEILSFLSKNLQNINTALAKDFPKHDKCVEIKFIYDNYEFSSMVCPISFMSSRSMGLWIIQNYSIIIQRLLTDLTISKEDAASLTELFSTNQIYKAFDLPQKHLLGKLKVWKDNYPEAYNDLVAKFEIPTVEELEKINL